LSAREHRRTASPYGWPTLMLMLPLVAFLQSQRHNDISRPAPGVPS
jgi:hypothetical protein